MEKIKTTLRDTKWGRWTALIMVSFTMLCAYYLTDAIAPLKSMLHDQLRWSATDYGTYTSGYGWFNVFLLMLVIAGIVLDKMGVRFTGVLSILIMIAGASLKYWAISGHVSADFISVLGWSVKGQVFVAGLGFAIFGVGCEMFGIAANKAVVRWFKGKELALAIGLNTSTGRIGTALAMFTPVLLVNATHNICAPILLSLLLLCIGLLAFFCFCIFDRKLDVQEGVANTAPDESEKFKLSDIGKIAKVRAFWYVSILCVLFYSAVFPFIKYATDLMVQKFDVPLNSAGFIPALLPLGALFLTPFFGNLYDKKGKGGTIMIIGSVILLCVHLLFAIPYLNSVVVAIGLVVVLGIAFSLVPSAMWPSIAKIIPEQRLGTAYALTFWIQNWGLMGVPLLIGYFLDRYCVVCTLPAKWTGIAWAHDVIVYDYTLPMLTFACFGALAILFAVLLKREDAKMGYGLEKPNMVDADA